MSIFQRHGVSKQKIVPSGTFQQLITPKKEAGRTGYLTLAFGTTLSNAVVATTTFFQKSTDRPTLLFPENAWLHSIAISAGYEADGLNNTEPQVQSMAGFPVRVRFGNSSTVSAVQVISGNGQGGPPDPVDTAPLVPFDNILLLPVGEQIKFEKYQYPLSSQLNIISLEAAGWIFAAGIKSQVYGFMGATVVIGYD